MSTQQPAGGGGGGVGPTSASRRGQKLTNANACWLRAHQQTLNEHLPIPGATWRWSECNLSRSILCDMRNRGLIEQREAGWETTRRAWDALERYGNTSEDERGEIVGQQELEAYVREARGKR